MLQVLYNIERLLQIILFVSRKESLLKLPYYLAICYVLPVLNQIQQILNPNMLYFRTQDSLSPVAYFTPIIVPTIENEFVNNIPNKFDQVDSNIGFSCPDIRV